FLGVTPAETMALVCGAEPVPPRSLRRDVARDLETVCLKCLAKEPHRRYASAQALAEDLCRFREGRPITARPVGQVGRAWRGCGRRPVLAGVRGALLLVVPGALAGLTGLYLHAGGQRELAEDRTQEARAQQSEAARQRQLVPPGRIGLP